MTYVMLICDIIVFLLAFRKEEEIYLGRRKNQGQGEQFVFVRTVTAPPLR